MDAKLRAVLTALGGTNPLDIPIDDAGQEAIVLAINEDKKAVVKKCREICSASWINPANAAVSLISCIALHGNWDKLQILTNALKADRHAGYDMITKVYFYVVSYIKKLDLNIKGNPINYLPDLVEAGWSDTYVPDDMEAFLRNNTPLFVAVCLDYNQVLSETQHWNSAWARICVLFQGGEPKGIAEKIVNQVSAKGFLSLPLEERAGCLA